MKRVILTVLGLVFLAAAPAGAAILGSAHDLRDGVGAHDDASLWLCEPCHTPHKPVQNVPLWSHTLSGAAGYRLYNDNASYASPNTGEYDAAAGVNWDFSGSLSRACLSCHDGTEEVVAGGGKLTYAADPDAWIFWDGGTDVAAGSNLGLKGSHPVAVDYTGVNTNQDAEYQDPVAGALGAGGEVKLEGGTHVQCTSCHNAHLPVAATKMLVLDNSAGLLCTACHIK